jgi:hypothetical protein
MRNPGDKRIESATAWAARREDTGVVEMYLEGMSAQINASTIGENEPLQRERQEYFRRYHRAPLEADCCPGIIAQIVDLQHSGIYPEGDLRQKPFEVGEKRRIVERPF